MLWKWRPLRIKPVFIKATFIEIIKVGFPIFVVGIVLSLWGTLNNTLVLKLGGVANFGLFALATMVEGSLSIFANAMNQVLYPKMSFSFGSKMPLKEIYKIPIKPVLIISSITIPVIITGWFSLPFIVKSILPNYLGGVEAAQWTLLLLVMAIFTPYNLIFNVIRKQAHYLISILCGIFIFIVSFFLLYNLLGFNLIIFPICMLFGKVSQFLIAIYYLRNYLKMNNIIYE